FIALHSSIVESLQDSDVLRCDQAVLDLTIKNSFQVVGDVSSSKAVLEYYPLNSYRQQVLNVTTIPEALTTSSGFEYIFGNSNNNQLFLKAKIVTHAKQALVRDAHFPLQVPDSLRTYLKPGIITDTNKDIKQLAVQLTGNANSELEAVSNIAEWIINNVQYNLSTSNVKASKPSTWVFANRQGVCDEITSLFISMLRSVGIPARFVSGIAFTDYPGIEGWGGHGWAEVYFPQGWIPFDVTYKQFGWVDASHIALAKTLDPGVEAVSYEAKGFDVEIKPKPLDYDVKFESCKTFFNEGIGLSLELFQQETGFNTYNGLKVRVYNNDACYKAVIVRIAAPKQIIVFNDSKLVIIPPKSFSEAYWLLKAPKLDPMFEYKMPIIAYTSFTNASTEWVLANNLPVLDLNPETFTLQNSLKKQSISVQCMDVEGFANEFVTIHCNAEKTVKMCLYDENRNLKQCFTGTNITFKYKLNFTGVKVLPVKVLTKKPFYTFVTIYSKDEPSISIDLNLDPEILHYNEIGTLELKLEKNSSSNPLNVSITISIDDQSKTWHVPILDSKKVYVLNFDSQLFTLGNHEVLVVITFKDEKGRFFKKVLKTSFKLKASNIFDYFESAMISVEHFLDKIF
ncbi:transglutaminase domain-containing protein, partial [Candidatus Woesearchaeota archaeon]|nr:transglutaminase domain-containing protein [Candidatus Woesearchaeota archaeon]